MTGYMARAKIIALMAEQHIDVRQMTERLGCTRAYLDSLFGGRRPLTVSELQKFARILDVPLEELTEGLWYGCPQCGAVAPQPTHNRVDCPEANYDLLPAVPR